MEMELKEKKKSRREKCRGCRRHGERRFEKKLVGYGFASRVKVYETFLKGTKDGLKIEVDVPTLIGLLVEVEMLLATLAGTVMSVVLAGWMA